MIHNKAGHFLGDTPGTGSGLMSGHMPPNQTPMTGRMQDDPYRSGPMTSLGGQGGSQGLRFPASSSHPAPAPVVPSASAVPAEPSSAISRIRQQALRGPDRRVETMPSRGDAFGGVVAPPDHDTNRGGWGTRGAVLGGQYQQIPTTTSGAFDRTTIQSQRGTSDPGAAVFPSASLRRRQAQAAGLASPSFDDPSDTDMFSPKLKRRGLGEGGEYVSGVSAVARGGGLY